MTGHDIIVVGASAGGVEALKGLAGHLPAGLPAAVFVVLHVPPDGTSLLPQILSRSGPLPAAHAKDGEAIEPGRIYVAPPDFHLLLRKGTVGLVRGPRENGHRPSADALFRSAARYYGRRVVGVVLSGTLDDGSAGLVAIQRRGGLAVIQDPEEALFPGMPRNAARQLNVDHSLPVAEVGRLVDRLARQPLPDEGGEPVPDEILEESQFAEFDMAVIGNDEHHPGSPSGFGCPDCGGALWVLKDGELERFRCRVGHAWSAHGLIAKQSEALEEALWVAMRALEERAALAGRMSDRMKGRGTPRLAARYAEQRADCKRQADLIREILSHPPDDVEPEGEAEPEPNIEPAPAGESNHHDDGRRRVRDGL